MAQNVIGTLLLEIGTNLSALHTGLKEASGKIDTWASQTQKRLKPFEDSALAMGAAFGAIAIGVGLAVKSFGDFNAKMNGVASVSGATAAEIDKIRATAVKMGADTQFSATEAADGFYELGKAGFTASEQLATMPGVVDLAGAAQVRIGEAAETTAGILRGFGLEAGRAGMVADQLAKAANASAVDVGDLAESMKYVAPVARASGQGLSEVMGILATLGNNMIKGSEAGTAMRSMLVSLQKPSDDAATILNRYKISIQDTQGRMLPLTDIVGQLRERMHGLTETQRANALATIFGQEALSSVMVLYNQAPGALEKMVKAQDKATGSAKAMADGLNKGSKFMREQFMGSVDTLAIKIGKDLEPAVILLFDALTKLVNALSDMPAPVRTVVLVLGGLTAAVTGLSGLIGLFSSTILPQFVAGFKALGVMLNVTTTAVRTFMAAWGPWAAIAAGVIAAVVLIQNKLADLNADLDETIRKNNELASASGKVAKDGGAAWAKYSKGIRLTKDEAKAALLWIRNLQTEAASSGNSALASRRRSQGDALQAMINRGDLATSGPARGAAVAAPKPTKAPAKPKAAPKGPNPNGEQYGPSLADFRASQIENANTALQKALTLNERWKTGIAGQIDAYQTYLDQLKIAGADGDKIAEVERKILDLKQQQVDKQQQLIDKGKQAAMALGGMAQGGMQAADEGGVGATPGFLAQNAGMIAQLPQMLMDMATGLQQAIPALSSALPALAPMFTSLSGVLSGVIAGGLAPLIPIAAGIVSALTLLMLVWQTNAGGIQQAMGNLMGALGGLWSSVVGFLQPVIDLVGAVFANIANQLALVFAVVGTVIDVFNAIRDAIWNAIMGFEPLKAVVDGIAAVFGALWDGVVGIINWIRGFFGLKAIEFQKAGPKQSLAESSAAKREAAAQATQPELNLPQQIGQAVASGVQEVMGQFTSFNPLPVEDQSRANALFSQGPSGRWFVSQETRATIDLNLRGDVDSDKLIAAVQHPQVRSALADAVGRENATINLIPRFA